MRTDPAAEAQRERAGYVVLALQLYTLVSTALYLIRPHVVVLGCLSPLTFLSQFLENWFPPVPVILTLACLPLAGWVLLRRGHRFGLYLMRALHEMLLAANAVVTSMHFISNVGVMQSPRALGITMLLCLSNLLVSVLSLLFLGRWKPNIKF